MEVIRALLEERNSIETEPFIAIIDSHVALNVSLLELENSNAQLKLENARQKDEIYNLSSQLDTRGPTKTELKQQEKIKKLEEQIYEKKNVEIQLAKQHDIAKDLEGAINNLKEEIAKKELKINQLNEQVDDAQSLTKLTEKQYDGLKDNIRRLQEENDRLSKNYEEIEGRILHEKEKFAELMNNLNSENEELKKKIEMLTELNQQEKNRFIWSAKGKKSNNNADHENENMEVDKNNRKFGSSGVVVPTSISMKIAAHQRQATSLRYDSIQGECIATTSEDSTVRLWSTRNGQMLKSFRSGGGNVILGVDLNDLLVAACGTDKMCRIWNTRTERLIHQLVGHSSKVTCTRFTNGEKSILTASADRSIKVWDITRSTYRQTVTLRHSSTAHCMDTSYDSITAVTGHLDGGVRFWDVRSSERTADISDLHSNVVTSVQFNPTNNAEVLTLGRDSVLKLIDVRKSGEELQSFYHSAFRIDLSYAGCAISPDGKYVAAGSSMGDIFIWRTVDGNLENQLQGHSTGVVSVAWGRGDGQQFSSVDKQGCLYLWA